MLERALYAFEMAWHPAFSPANGNCRLDFAHQPNRAFFKCLFRQTQVQLPAFKTFTAHALYGTAAVVSVLQAEALCKLQDLVESVVLDGSTLHM
jgi:hypothetical protein